MLSFLREQGGADVPSRKPKDAAGQISSNGVEPSQEEKFLTVASHKVRTRRSTILLAVLFIAGLLCLWFMIRKSTPSTAVATTVDANSEQDKIESAMTRLIGVKSEMSSRMDEIVNKFYEFSNVLQVRVNELAKNPFTLDLLTEGSKKPGMGPIDVAHLRRQEIERRARELKLLSIMQSDQGRCCMIGNRILREGDSIKDFVIRQIGENSVRIEWKPEQEDRPPGAGSERVEIVLELTQ